MPTLISYQKFINQQITREINLPTDAGNQRLGQEIATIAGTTYVVLPDGATLPASQPPEIAASIATVTLTPILRKAIAAASPQMRLIRANVAAKIAEQYSLQDEVKLIRTRPSAEFDEYHAHAEACRTWGAEQRAALGL